MNTLEFVVWAVVTTFIIEGVLLMGRLL